VDDEVGGQGQVGGQGLGQGADGVGYAMARREGIDHVVEGFREGAQVVG
jgi:hypothetical protein